MAAVSGLGHVLVTAVLCAASAAAAATVLTYTESNDFGDNVALGYPVPGVVDTATPVDGFRSYAALLARHRDLAGSDHVTETRLGTSLDGRAIVGFVVGDADTRIDDGAAAEGAALINGGIHAREWQSPEVVSALLERLAARDDAVSDFVVGNLTTVIVPVLNVDGFMHTQRTPARTLATTFDEDPPSWPRDGRMRRKNMRGVDEDLFTESDGLRGVDLNRNNAPFWARSSRSSARVGSLVHHGSGPASEPEIIALQAAAAAAPADRLRLFVDAHSFGRVFFAADTGNARRDRNARALIDRVRAATSGYAYDPSSAGVGIGATDEYFAYTYQIPSYTLEIEPGPNGGADYGGTGVTHSGFVLPESQIARVREELAGALLLGLYRQSGPPVALAARAVHEDGLVYDGAWVPTDNGRSLTATQSGRLPVGTLTVSVQFDRPMRLRDGATVVQYPGQAVPLLPTVRLTGEGADGQAFTRTIDAAAMRWSRATESARYAADTLVFTVDVAADSVLGSARLVDVVIDAQDLSGQRLDVNPATPTDWVDGGWSGYEDAQGRLTDTGGPSPAFRLVGNGHALETLGTRAPAGGGSGALSGLGVAWMSGLALLACRRRARAGRPTA